MYNIIRLVNITLSFYPINFQRNFLNNKKLLCQWRTQLSSVFSTDTTATNHCGITYYWWVRIRDTQPWFLHFPNWHFSLRIPIYFCAHFYLRAPQLQHYLRGRWFPTLPNALPTSQTIQASEVLPSFSSVPPFIDLYDARGTLVDRWVHINLRSPDNHIRYSEMIQFNE